MELQPRFWPPHRPGTLGLNQFSCKDLCLLGDTACSQAWAPGISSVWGGLVGRGPERLVPPTATCLPPPTPVCLLCPITACPLITSVSRVPSLTNPLLSNGHCWDGGGTYCKLRGAIKGWPRPGTRWDLSRSYIHPTGMSLAMSLTPLPYSVPGPPPLITDVKQGGARQ